MRRIDTIVKLARHFEVKHVNEVLIKFLKEATQIGRNSIDYYVRLIKSLLDFNKMGTAISMYYQVEGQYGIALIMKNFGLRPDSGLFYQILIWMLKQLLN